MLTIEQLTEKSQALEGDPKYMEMMVTTLGFHVLASMADPATALQLAITQAYLQGIEEGKAQVVVRAMVEGE